MYESTRNIMLRKKNRLTSVPEKLNVLANEDQVTVINKSLRSSSNSDVNYVLAITEIDSMEEARFGCQVLQLLKTLDCRSSENRDYLCPLLKKTYGDEVLTNENLLSWLAQRVKYKSWSSSLYD